MPKNPYPNNIHKSNVISKKGKIFTGLFVFVALLLCFSFANIFSNFITTGFFSLSDAQEIKGSSFKVYAISTKKSALKEEVQSFVSDLQRRGGAGYVWSIDGMHHLFASCYIQENDAKKVQDSLVSSGIDCEITTLDFENISVSTEISQGDKQAFLNSVGVFKTTYLSLYDISVALDTKVSSKVECVATISTIKADIEKVRQTFNQTFSQKLTKDLIQIKLALSSCKETIEELSAYSGENFSSEIKYTYFKVLKMHSNLYDDINDKI